MQPILNNFMTTFQDLHLPELILSALQDLGFETPTPIQAEVIPVLLETNRDIIGLAQTGTGKTAAFGLPAIALTEIEDRFPQTLVLSPTRELCLQITEDLKKFAKYIDGFNIVPVYGGSSIENQVRQLAKGAHIVVATPGRAKDLIYQRKLNISKVTRVILDEADEMLSMGFQDDLNDILEHTPDEKQTLLFSATMFDDIRRITKNYMKNPIEISVSKANSGSKNVRHVFYMTHAKDRYEALKRVVDMNPEIYGIIFCRTRQETKDVANKLMQERYNADVLHGELSQNMRDDVMNRFRKRQLQLLVATDVAARGLDVNDLTHVINYNLPDDAEVYTHRSGRTGRAGKTGVSVVIVHSREGKKIKDIEKMSGITFENLAVPTGEEVCQVQLMSLIEKIKNIEVNDKQIEPFLPEIYSTFEGLTREELIKHFVSAEFNRFLSYYKNAQDINVSHESGSHSTGSRRRSDDNFTRLFINIGKRDKLNPARLIGIINEALDSNDAAIGKIELLNNFSFVEIQSDLAESLMSALIGQPFGNIKLNLEVSENKSGNAGRSRKGGFDRSRNFSKSDNNKAGGNGARKDRYKKDNDKDWSFKKKKSGYDKPKKEGSTPKTDGFLARKRNKKNK